jgi:hypothetical protein
MVSGMIGRTATEVIEAEMHPSPYDDSECRQSLFASILGLLQNPVPMSPISLSFYANLLRKTEFDFQCLQVGHRMRSTFERIVHPICPTLNFPVVLPETEKMSQIEGAEEEMEEDSIQLETIDRFCQTDELRNLEAQPTKVQLHNVSQNELDLETSVSLAVESTMKKFFQRFREQPVDDEEFDSEFNSTPSSSNQFLTPLKPVALTLSNGTESSKRKYEDLEDTKKYEDIEITNSDSDTPASAVLNGNDSMPCPKRSKERLPGDTSNELDLETMLQDFVDLPAVIQN